MGGPLKSLIPSQPAVDEPGSAKKKPKVVLAKQSAGTVPTALSVCLLSWAFAQEVMRPSDMRMTLGTGFYVLVASYLYTDFWLWLLHCFLDRKECLTSRIPIIAYMAKQFQDHHDVPATVLLENHLGEIDDLCSGVLGMGLLMGYWTSPATKLIFTLVCVWGGLGGLNHFYGHAITHGHEVPALYKYGQRWGLLPSAKHHKLHHTAPHEENWNFLNGLNGVLYEPVYFASKSSFAGLFALFYVCNPIVLQVWAVASGILV